MKRAGLAAASVFAFAAAAFALPPAGVPEGKWWRNPRVAHAIHLTSDQSDRIEAIFLRTKPKLIDLKADLEKKELLLRSLMDGASVDREEASRRIDDLEQARARLSKAQAMMFVEIRQVLSKEQFHQLNEMRMQLRERRDDLRRRFRGPPGPDDGPGPGR